jgi:hypothetical protein
MKPDKLLGWTIENPGKRSHVIGTTDIVVGIRNPAVCTVSFSLCGTKGHAGSVQREPNNTPCARCLGVAFKLARKNQLPDISI